MPLACYEYLGHAVASRLRRRKTLATVVVYCAEPVLGVPAIGKRLISRAFQYHGLNRLGLVVARAARINISIAVEQFRLDCVVTRLTQDPHQGHIIADGQKRCGVVHVRIRFTHYALSQGVEDGV